jgi:crotonobetainyl-CoA:carnitine CoA-transferase CaiB-like acyl-CoA transferase
MDQPALIPAAATDYTTGYLAAAGVVSALVHHPGGAHVDVSLVQTAQWLLATGATLDPERATGLSAAATTDRLVEERSPWGRIRRLPFPLTVDGLDLGWEHPAEPLGHSAPVWLPR